MLEAEITRTRKPFWHPLLISCWVVGSLCPYGKSNKNCQRVDYVLKEKLVFKLLGRRELVSMRKRQEKLLKSRLLFRRKVNFKRVELHNYKGLESEICKIHFKHLSHHFPGIFGFHDCTFNCFFFLKKYRPFSTPDSMLLYQRTLNWQTLESVPVLFIFASRTHPIVNCFKAKHLE